MAISEIGCVETKDAKSRARVEHELKVYQKVPHGFAVYGSYEDEYIKTAQKEANEQMLAWLLKYKS